MNDSEFDSLLRSAGSVPPVPEDFHRSVWRRIEARENEDTALPQLGRAPSSFWTAVAATAIMAATVILGATLGLHSRPDNKQAKAEYVRSISPFARP